MLRVEMPDGTVQRIISNADWKTIEGQSDLTWTAKDFDAGAWPNASVAAEIGRERARNAVARGAHFVARARFHFDQSGALRSHLFHGAGNVSAVFERHAGGRRYLGAGLDRLSEENRLSGL